MKKLLAILLSFLMCFSATSCAVSKEEEAFIPEFSQMKSICELATTKCFFHNVAKFTDKDRSRFLWLKKDAHFWIEYSGTVTIGIDASQLEIEVSGLDVRITLPQAKVLGVNIVDPDKANYIVAKNSAKIDAKDEIYAISEAQSEMELSAKNNALLLSTARENAKKLIGEYIKNVGIAFGKDYKITWIYADENGNAVEIVTEEATSNEQ